MPEERKSKNEKWKTEDSRSRQQVPPWPPVTAEAPTTPDRELMADAENQSAETGDPVLIE
jgi:hypothetical protein